MKLYECLVMAQLEANQTGDSMVLIDNKYGENPPDENYEYCPEEFVSTLYPDDIKPFFEVTQSPASKENFEAAQKQLLDTLKFVQENSDGV